MNLYDVTNTEWARKIVKASVLEKRGLELTMLDVLNYCSEEFGDDEDNFKPANYQLIDEYTVYRDGRVDVLDGGDDVLEFMTPEFGTLYLSYAYKCESGQAILVFYKTLEDAFECENEVLISL